MAILGTQGQVLYLPLVLIGSLFSSTFINATEPAPREGFAASAASETDLQSASILDQDNIENMSLNELLNIAIPEVTTASQKQEQVQAAPATVLVITQNDLRMRGYGYLSEVLRDLPDMETIDDYWAEVGTLVPVRGVVGNNKIIVLLNGARLNPPGGEPMMFHRDFSVRYAKQIEIVYGPGSTMYGQDAISAVINIITKDASKSPELEAGVAGGYPNTKEGWVSYNGPLGDTDVSAHVRYLDTALTDIQNFDKQRYRLHVDYANNLGDSDEFTRGESGLNVFTKLQQKNWRLQLWYRQSSSNSSEGLGPAFSRMKEAKWKDSSLILEAANTINVSETLFISSHLQFSRYEINPESRVIYPDDSNTRWQMNDWKYGLGNALSIEERFTWQHDMDSLKLTAIGGVVGKYHDILPKFSSERTIDTKENLISQSHIVEYYFLQYELSSLVQVPSAQNVIYRSLGSYLELTGVLFDRLRIIGGLRGDYNSRVETVPLSPRVAVSFDIIPELTAKYIFSKAFVAPAPYYSHSVAETDRAIIIPNPDLDPEQSTANEINLLFKNEKFHTSLSGFYKVNRKLIIQADSYLSPNISDTVYVRTTPTQWDSKDLLMSANAGTSIVYGGEFSFRFAIWRLQAWGSYSYVDKEEKIAGRKYHLDMISNHNFKAGVTQSITDNLFATLSFWARSRPQSFTYSPTVSRYFEEQRNWPWEINLNSTYTPYPNFNLLLTVRNLTNHRYAAKALYSSETGNAQVKEGISVLIGAQYIMKP
ncbi:MAG: TonB-dependent receptor [Deltaproteobacteria bacterium]|nr:TonB-dependent receptor [Deltaproteobacteria bacterium]